jgi:hypothetical protein
VSPPWGIFGVRYPDFIGDPVAMVVNISKYFCGDDFGDRGKFRSVPEAIRVLGNCPTNSQGTKQNRNRLGRNPAALQLPVVFHSIVGRQMCQAKQGRQMCQAKQGGITIKSNITAFN